MNYNGYINALAEDIKEKSLEIVKKKQEYMKDIQQLGNNFKKGVDAKKVLKEHFNNQNYIYKATSVNKLLILTKDGPIDAGELSVLENKIKDGLQGEIQYTR